MNTQKIAISVPADLVAKIDIISKQKGMSRSRFISTVLHEKVLNEEERQIKEVYNRVLSDDSIKKTASKHLYGLMGLETNRGWNGNVFLRKGECEFSKKCVVNITRIKSVDKRSIKEKIGTLSKNRMDQVHEGLKIVTGIP